MPSRLVNHGGSGYYVPITMPFQKGNSANPGGRPKKGKSLAERLEAFGYTKNPETKRKYYDDMVSNMWKRAARGDLEATRYIMDRVLGKPGQSVTLKGDDAAPLHVRHSARLDIETPAQLLAPEQATDAAEGEVVLGPGGPGPEPGEPDHRSYFPSWQDMEAEGTDALLSNEEEPEC